MRVLSHEINNSLTPIKSIAHSIKRMLSRVPDLPRAEEIQDGLNLIETRSGSLGRFLRAYAQLARLPKPQQRPDSDRANRPPDCGAGEPAAGRRREGRRRGDRGGSRSDRATADQHRPQCRGCDARDQRSRLDRLDRRSMDRCRSRSRTKAPGLPDTSNLFVPFFTTKPPAPGSVSRSAARSPRRTAARWRSRIARSPKAAARSCACRSEEKRRGKKEE